jgi:hypothetical protein
MQQHFKEDMDAVRNVPESEWKKTDEAITFPSGFTGYVRPEFQGAKQTDKWHWALEKDGKVFSHGYAENKAQAKKVIEVIEPNFAAGAPPMED